MEKTENLSNNNNAEDNFLSKRNSANLENQLANNEMPFFSFRPHPWHGLEVGSEPKEGRINAFIEITPFDLVKYEIDKKTGFMRVDRP